MIDLKEEFGNIDIYLFDQLLRGNIAPAAAVLDAGCGGGRNLIYFLRAGFNVFAVDRDRDAVQQVRELASLYAPKLPQENFRVGSIESMTFPEASVDAVVSNAVLHFAKDDEQFWNMLASMWRSLRPGGLFFSRLASTIGMESRMTPVVGRRFFLPDGTERYLVDEPYLMELTRKLGGSLVDPLKTTIVQNQRSMTTWVLRK